MSIHTKVALVTGGGQGIGKAIALRFLQAGMSVVIGEIDDEAGRETAAELARYGAIRYVPADVASEPDVQRLVEETLAAFGRLDVLVNNAAIGIGKPITGLSLVEWNRVLAVNLTGPFLCAKYAAPHLAATQGAIVNIASTRAVMSEANTEAYAASKGGIVALTHALAVSLGPDVRVNGISPGWIETGDWKKAAARVTPVHTEQDHRQHPAGRVGVPDDIAALALYLVSPESTFITGANFTVDGGMTRKMIYV